MDSKTFLIKSATLLYLESLISEPNERSYDLVRTGVERLEKSKVFDTTLMQASGDMLRQLKDAVVALYNDQPSGQYSREELLQQFRIILASDEKLYEALEQGLSD